MNNNAQSRQPDDPAELMKEWARQSFPVFLRKAVPWVTGGSPVKWNWHLDAIAHELDLICKGQSHRLLVTLPPRNLKSITISVAWVAWKLGRDPTLNFICVSYSGELSAKLARLCLSIMQSPWYRELFPRTIISPKRSAAFDFDTTVGGGRMATSIGGTLTGRGGDIIIIDDPLDPSQAYSDVHRENVNRWYRSTLSSRLDDKQNGALICVMQRLHQNDLAGVIIENGGWNHLCLPAIATENSIIDLPRGRKHYRREGDVLHPEHEPLEVLNQMALDQGSLVFRAQYQQDPVPADGNMIQAHWLIHMDGPMPAHGEVVQSWDTASKDGIHNDFSVCITARLVDRHVYILDVFRKKLQFPDLLKAAANLALEFKARTMLVEDAASGTQLIKMLERAPLGVPSPIPRKPELDKKSRVAGISSLIEAGRLILPAQAHWLGEFEAELLGFPNAKFDDQVDALSQLLSWALHKLDRPPSLSVGPMLVIEGEYRRPTKYIPDEYRDPWGAY